jgi:hypothetical protein
MGSGKSDAMKKKEKQKEKREKNEKEKEKTKDYEEPRKTGIKESRLRSSPSFFLLLPSLQSFSFSL